MNGCSNFQTLNSLKQISRESSPFRGTPLINPFDTPYLVTNTETFERSILEKSPVSAISQTESLPEAPIIGRKTSLRN